MSTPNRKVAIGTERQKKAVVRANISGSAKAATTGNVASRRVDDEEIPALRFEEALANMSAAFVRLPADQISAEIERWLRYVVLTFGIDRATIGQTNFTDGLVYLTHQWARDGVTPAPYRVNANQVLPWLTSRIMNGETVVLADVKHAPPEATKDLEYARAVGCKSNVTVSLRIGGVVAGAVGFDSVTKSRNWSKRMVQRLCLMAEMFGNALERERVVVENRRLAEQVRRASRIAHMGELTASLAHELNQPLGAILNNAQAARRFLAAKKPNLREVRAAVEEIIHDNSRAVETLRNVRAFFQREQVEMSPVDLRQILLEVHRGLSLEAKSKGISIRLDLPSSLPVVVANRAQFVEVLMSLVANAFDSICEEDDGPRVVDLCARLCESGHVQIAVRDSGKGIDPAIMPRLFDAFFTTKRNGMGIGLRIAHSIIKSYDGRLWATNNPDGGATLIFELPAKASESDRE